MCSGWKARATESHRGEGVVLGDGGSDDHFYKAAAAEAGLDAGSDGGVSGGDPLIPLSVKFGCIGEVGKVDDDLQQ